MIVDKPLHIVNRYLMENRKKSKKKAEDEELLMTIQDAAKLRGVTRTRIYQWIDEGRLRKETRFGRSVVYRDEVLAIEALPGGRPRKNAE